MSLASTRLAIRAGNAVIFKRTILMRYLIVNGSKEMFPSDIAYSFAAYFDYSITSDTWGCNLIIVDTDDE